MRLVSVYGGHQVLQRVVGELIDHCERPTSDHDLDCLVIEVLLELTQLLETEYLFVNWTNCWFPYPVDIEFLSVHESLSNDDLAFEKCIIWNLSDVEL